MKRILDNGSARVSRRQVGRHDVWTEEANGRGLSRRVAGCLGHPDDYTANHCGYARVSIGTAVSHSSPRHRSRAGYNNRELSVYFV